jgi:hypothetical protein
MPSTPPLISEGTVIVETTTGPTYDELVDDKHTPHTSSRGGTKGIQEQQLLSEQVCAADVDKDEEGTPIVGVKGMKWETLVVNNLRIISARHGLKGYKNANEVRWHYRDYCEVLQNQESVHFSLGK